MKKCVCWIIFLCLTCTFAAEGSAYLPEERMVAWENAGYPGEIPNVSTNLRNVKDYGAAGNGITDDYSAIANALDSAPNPAVIFFPEGTYRIRSQLMLPSGIVLRGAGADKTKLNFEIDMDSGGCIENTGYSRGAYTDIQSGITKGTRNIYVSDVSGFDVGRGAQIKQTNNLDKMHLTHPQYWVAEDAIGQMTKVVAIDANAKMITIDPPLHLDFEAHYNPMIRPITYTTNIGIEDLYITRVHIGSDPDNNVSNTIVFNYVADSWIRRIGSEYTYRAHVGIGRSVNVEVRDSYIFNTHTWADGGHGYGVSIYQHTTHALIENNCFQLLKPPMMMQVGANANVWGYNYMYQESNPDWQNHISIHGHYTYMNLIEGNIVDYIRADDYWGASGPGNTIFRNRVLVHGIRIFGYSHDQNIIGNELPKERSGGNGNDIEIKDTVAGTLIHGNVEEIKSEPIAWDPSLSRTMPASLYRSEKPTFFGSLAWPALGGDLGAGNLNTIPAKQRFDRGNPLYSDPGSSPPSKPRNLAVDK